MIALLILMYLLLGLGFIGCFINKFPGPLLAFIGLLIGKIGIGIPFDWWVLGLVAVLVAASMYTSRKVVPELAKKVAPFTKGATGTTLGSIIGLLVIGCAGDSSIGVLGVMAFIGLAVIPFACAFVFEKTVQKDSSAALASAIGATTVYLANAFLKLIVVVLSVYFAIFS